MDTLGDEEPAYAHLEDSSLVGSGLEALDERERRIVELRFFHGLTQSQIAAEIGISQMCRASSGERSRRCAAGWR